MSEGLTQTHCLKHYQAICHICGIAYFIKNSKSTSGQYSLCYVDSIHYGIGDIKSRNLFLILILSIQILRYRKKH